MTLEDARKILGLGPKDDPAAHLAEFRQARERIAEFVRSAPNETLALRYQEGLVEFDRALAAIREHQELPEILSVMEPTAALETAAVTLEPPPVPSQLIAAAVAAEAAVAPQIVKRRNSARWLAWSLVFLLALLGGGYLYLRMEEDRKLQLKGRIAFLERQGAIFVENRRWDEARDSYKQIEELEPDSEIISMGRRSIEAGIDEEQKQFLGYWSGEALAAFESNRLDDAQKAVEQALSKFPNDPGAIDMRRRIERSHSAEKIRLSVSEAQAKLDEHDWEAAIQMSAAVLQAFPGQPEATTILSEASAGRKKSLAELAQARELLVKAQALDQGSFNPQALDFLRQAAVLAPGDKDIAGMLEKMSSYSRTVRVPGDFTTPAEAMAKAKDHDRIVIEAGQWQGPLLVDKQIEIQGAGSGKTTLDCAADASSVISFGPGAQGVRVTGITFRHRLLDPGTERFAVALVKGGEVTFADCHFLDAAGHGLDVIAGGKASAQRCRFSGNGWDGASASGVGSFLEIRESEVIGNFEHGLDLWDGAGGALVGNRSEGNSRNGIQIDAKTAAVSLTDNVLRGNREFGIVLASAFSGEVRGNSLSGNFLGGLVVRSLAAKITVTGNTIQSSNSPAVVLEKGLPASGYKSNEVAGTVMGDVDFDAPKPEKP